MSSDKDKKKHRDEREPPREGSVVPEHGHEDFVEWLTPFWERTEQPDRIELWQAFGQNGMTRGHRLHVVDFKKNDPLDVERVTRLVNEIVAVAQHDADCRGHLSLYQVDVHDPYRGAIPISRRLGPIAPKTTYLQQINKANGAGGGGDFDDEDVPGSVRSLDFARIKEANDQIRWGHQLNLRVLGEVLQNKSDEIAEWRNFSRELMQGFMASIKAQAEAVRSVKMTEVEVEERRFWLDFKKEGVKTVRNMLPGFFAPAPGAGQPETITVTANGSSPQQGQPSQRLHGWSPEKVLVTDFLADCEKEKLDIQLFGEWERDAQGRMIPTPDKPGIFRPEQCMVLFEVAMGVAPASYLDLILPGSTDPRAITMDQATKAGEILPQSMQHAIGEMISLRQKAHAAAQPAPAPTTPSAPTAER